MKKHSAGRGFTMLELMIVLAIIGIMTTLGTFTYLSSVQRIKVQNDVREINQTLQVARMRTLSTGIGHGILFLPDEKKYLIFVDCNDDGIFSGSNPLGSSHAPVNSAEACAAATTNDPRMANENIHELQGVNSLYTPSGTLLATEKYIVFNNMGQTMQGSSPRAGDIIIRGSEEDGMALQGVIRLNASGLAEVIPIQRVDY